MVSKQVKGLLRVYMEAPSGARKLIMSAPNYWYAPGGSSEGVIANTPVDWNFFPMSAHRGTAGYKIVYTMSGSAETMDASDGVYIMPLMVNGSLMTIGNPAAAGGLGNDHFSVDVTPADIALVAASETTIAVFRAKEGVTFQIGGGKVFLSVEDNS